MLNQPAGMVDYGNFSTLYAFISFVNVIYTYGMETAYFRFSSTGTDQKKLFQTTFTSLLLSSVVFSAAIILFRVPIAEYAGLEQHSEYITWCVLILAIDTMAAIPFARLRQEERPRKYAFVRVAGIMVNILLTLFFLVYSPGYISAHPTGAYAHWYAQNTNVGFLILANLTQAAVTFLLLYREWLGFRFQFDPVLWKKIFTYSAPMVIVGLGGMVNETIDRIMLPKLYGTKMQGAIENAMYAANYKIAIFITLFITAFRMSAEPFFFSQSTDKNAPKTYARVMKWFVIILCLAFLFTSLYLDVLKYIVGPQYRRGDALGVVPILLAANVCLGIYYNLSVWYKITDKVHIGMYVTLMGATLTLVSNTLFIPRFGMYACAWTTFAAYCSMMIVSYLLGQKYFPVPYNLKKLLAYLAVMVILFFAQQLVMRLTGNFVVRFVSASVFMAMFLRLVLMAEKKELAGMPFIGKYVK